MNYTVTWLPDAQNELADIWMAAAERNAVSAASHRIDQALATDPLDTGESRDADDRLVIDPPLQARFRVYADDRRVDVLAVGTYGR